MAWRSLEVKSWVLCLNTVDRAVGPSSQPEESVEEDPVPQGEPEVPDPGAVLHFVGSDRYVRGVGCMREGLPPVFELRAPVGGLIKSGSFKVVMDLLTEEAGGTLGTWHIEAPVDLPATSRRDQLPVRQPAQPRVNRRRPSHT